MKRKLLLNAMAACALFTACSSDELLHSELESESNVITMAPVLGMMTRSTEGHDLTTASLKSFSVTALHGEDTYFEDVRFQGKGGIWSSSNSYYWPKEGELTFHAFSPDGEDNGITRTSHSTFKVEQQTLAVDQPDFIVAKTTGSRETTRTGVPLNFRHAMSRISLEVKNSNTGLRMTVSDWKVGNLYNEGIFTLAEDDTDTEQQLLALSDWDMTGAGSVQSTSTEIISGSITPASIPAGSGVTVIDGLKDFIALPQQLLDATQYVSGTAGAEFEGSYIAVEMSILNDADGAVIIDRQWCYWPISTLWEPGRKYTYTVDLGTGGYYGHEGEDPFDSKSDGSLDPVLDGLKVRFVNVRVDDWDDAGKTDVRNQDLTAYLSFTAEEAGKVSLNKYGTTWKHEPSLEYSRDKDTWTAVSFGTSINLAIGETLYLRGDNPSGLNDKSNRVTINCTGRMHASGNVMSLIDPSATETEIPSPYCFYRLFGSSAGLVTPPSLPATELTPGCYMEMFSECSKLETAPALPAAVMKDSCYMKMFYNCQALKATPELQSTEMAQDCYSQMFERCEVLAYACDLPALELKKNCYLSMFEYCRGLKTPPVISATSVGFQSCFSMFRGSGLIEAPDLPAMTIDERCYANMFALCRDLTKAPDILPAMELADRCYGAMFNGCTKLEKAPVLPALKLADFCYQTMFYDCTSLNYLKVMFINTGSSNYALDRWTDNVPSTGTLVLNTAATWSISFALKNWTVTREDN